MALGDALSTFLKIVGLIGILSLVLFIAWFIASYFFASSVRRTMKSVPVQHQFIPAAFTWLLIVPGLHVLATWVLIPFAVPFSLMKSVSSNRRALSLAGLLMLLGLMYAVLLTYAVLKLIINLELNAVSLWAVAAWILYWFVLVKIRWQ
jgi:hypothetical protein